MIRRLKLGALTSFAAIAAACLTIFLLQFFHRPDFRVRWDWVGEGTATLSDRTAAALQELPDGSSATLFLYPEEEAYLVNGAAVYPRAFGLLRTALEDARIRAGGQLEVQVLDIRSAPVEMDAARTRLNRQIGECLILESEGGRQVLSFRDLFSVDSLSGTRPARLNSHRIDEALGNAASRLALGQLLKVAVLSSHIPGPAGDPIALAPFVRLLETEGFEAVSVGNIPAPDDGYDLLVVPGQMEMFKSSNADAAIEWVQSGLPLFVGLGFSAPSEVSSFWNSALSDLGVLFSDGLVCQRWRGNYGDSRCANELEIPPSRLQQTHPITSDLRLANRGLELQGVRPLSLQLSSENYLRDQLVWMDKLAWVETESIPDFAPGPSEKRGPFPIVVAAQPTISANEASGRIVLMGTAGPFYGGTARHRDFLAASTRWLLGEDTKRSGLVSLESLPFRPTQKVRAQLGNLSLLAIPGIALLIALLTRWRRKS
ncbi:MAG: hypothetical protein QGH51_06700 [Planctomycetota bacterium]|nr:hypothetical protein [Planctomycetota bacterium]